MSSSSFPKACSTTGCVPTFGVCDSRLTASGNLDEHHMNVRRHLGLAPFDRFSAGPACVRFGEVKRQSNREHAAMPLLALHEDVAPMLFDYVASARQAKSRAGQTPVSIRRAMKPLENVREVRGWNANALVADLNHSPRVPPIVLTAQTHADFGVVWAVLDGVTHQIAKRAFEPRCVPLTNQLRGIAQHAERTVAGRDGLIGDHTSYERNQICSHPPQREALACPQLRQIN